MINRNPLWNGGLGHLYIFHLKHFMILLFKKCNNIQSFIFTPYQRQWQRVIGLCSSDFLLFKQCLKSRSIVLVNCEKGVLFIEFYEFLKALWTVLSETINIMRSLQKKAQFLGCPCEFPYRFMYKVPSSDHSLLTHILPLKVILRQFKFVFWCLDWERCTLK